jgi:hypothetical protein
MKLLKIKGHLSHDEENSADVNGVWIDEDSLDSVNKEFGGLLAVLDERSTGYGVAFRDRRGAYLFVEEIFDTKEEAEKACKERMAVRRAEVIKKEGRITPKDNYDFLTVLDVANSFHKVKFRFIIS